MEEFDDDLLNDVNLDDLSDVNLTEEDIAKLVDEAPEVEAMTEQSLKKLILSLEKKVNSNQEKRIKFPDDPTKFMDTEIALDNAVIELSQVALNRDLYPLFIKLGTVRTLVSLLIHENTDISIDVVSVLNDLIAPEEELTGASKDTNVINLVDKIVQCSGIEALITNLERLEESQEEDRQGVFNTLSVVEHMIEVDPNICEALTSRSNLFVWLMKRIQVPDFEDNKLYASEILAILIQDSPKNRKQFCLTGGIEAFLVALSVYKKRDPIVGDEEEYVENMFNTLCSCLLEPENKSLFIKSEGFELMIRMLRYKGFCRKSALKVISFGLQDSKEACRRFISILGLRSLFSAFMRKPATGKRKSKKRKMEPTEVEEEHVINCISSLLKNLPQESKSRVRVIKKFTENEFQKTERLIELHFTYLRRVVACEARIQAERDYRISQGEEIDEYDEEEYFLRRLDEGLFTLQLVDYTFTQLSVTSPEIKETGEKLLAQEEGGTEDIKNFLIEYAGGSLESEDEVTKDIKDLLNQLNW